MRETGDGERGRRTDKRAVRERITEGPSFLPPSLPCLLHPPARPLDATRRFVLPNGPLCYDPRSLPPELQGTANMGNRGFFECRKALFFTFPECNVYK